jgi:hypothetical protein
MVHQLESVYAQMLNSDRSSLISENEEIQKETALPFS